MSYVRCRDHTTWFRRVFEHRLAVGVCCILIGCISHRSTTLCCVITSDWHRDIAINTEARDPCWYRNHIACCNCCCSQYCTICFDLTYCRVVHGGGPPPIRHSWLTRSSKPQHIRIDITRALSSSRTTVVYLCIYLIYIVVYLGITRSTYGSRYQCIKCNSYYYLYIILNRRFLLYVLLFCYTGREVHL